MNKQPLDQSDASDYVAGVRKHIQKQAQNQRTRVAHLFYFPRYLPPPPSVIKNIDRSLTRGSADLCGDGVTTVHMKTLMVRFEGRCCAMGQPVKNENRRKITELLVKDLRNNCKVLASLGVIDPTDLVWFTIFSGRIGDFQDLPKEYVKDIVTNHPIVAQESLSDTKRKAEKLIEQSKDPNSKLAPLAGKEELIRYAVLHYTSPANYLKQVLNGELEPPNLDAKFSGNVDVGSVVETFQKKQHTSDYWIFGNPMNRLGQDVQRDINKVANNLFSPTEGEEKQKAADMQRVGITSEQIIHLMALFEFSFGRVVGQTLSQHLRPAILKSVALDFLNNCEIIGGDPRNLLSLTIYHGRADDLVAEHSAEKIRRAAARQPSEPWKFLAAHPHYLQPRAEYLQPKAKRPSFPLQNAAITGKTSPEPGP